MSEKETLAKLEMLKAMTDLESVRQLCDIISTLVTGKHFKPTNYAIGFSDGSEEEGVEDDDDTA